METELIKEELPAPKSIQILTSIDDEEQEKVTDKAREEAVRAAPFTWNDKPLFAFAIDREADWLAWRGALNKPPLDTVFATRFGFLSDALAILWFCSVEPEEWIGLNPLVVDKKIREWAQSNVAPGEQEDIVVLALEIFTRAHITQVTIKSDSVGKSD